MDWAQKHVSPFLGGAAKFNYAYRTLFTTSMGLSEEMVEEDFAVELENGASFSFYRPVFLNKKIASYTDLQKLWNASLRSSPYEQPAEADRREIRDLLDSVPKELLGRTTRRAETPIEGNDDYELIERYPNLFVMYRYVPTNDFVLQTFSCRPSNYTDAM